LNSQGWAQHFIIHNSTNLNQEKTFNFTSIPSGLISFKQNNDEIDLYNNSAIWYEFEISPQSITVEGSNTSTGFLKPREGVIPLTLGALSNRSTTIGNILNNDLIIIKLDRKTGKAIFRNVFDMLKNGLKGFAPWMIDSNWEKIYDKIITSIDIYEIIKAANEGNIEKATLLAIQILYKEEVRNWITSEIMENAIDHGLSPEEAVSIGSKSAKSILAFYSYACSINNQVAFIWDVFKFPQDNETITLGRTQPWRLDITSIPGATEENVTSKLYAGERASIDLKIDLPGKFIQPYLALYGEANIFDTEGNLVEVTQIPEIGYQNEGRIGFSFGSLGEGVTIRGLSPLPCNITGYLDVSSKGHVYVSNYRPYYIEIKIYQGAIPGQLNAVPFEPEIVLATGKIPFRLYDRISPMKPIITFGNGSTQEIHNLLIHNTELDIDYFKVYVKKSGEDLYNSDPIIFQNTGGVQILAPITYENPVSSAEYRVQAVDISGNEGPLSDPLLIQSPTKILSFNNEIIYDFENVEINTSVNKIIKLSNSGSSPVHVSNLVLSNNIDFSIISESGNSFDIPVGGEVQVTVSFSPKSSGQKTAKLTITNDSENAPVKTISFTGIGNMEPIANAGTDKTVTEGDLVILDGSGSSDPDNDAITYKWTAPAGITLSSTTVAKPTFTAPEVDTNYPFSLVVNDGIADSPADEVIVTVKKSSLNDGLVAWYPFNGNANDESGNGNNGTVYGVNLTTDRFSYADKAYHFNSSERDFIKLPNNVITSNVEEFSVSAWYYDTSVDPNYQGRSIIHGSGEAEYGLSTFNNTGQFKVKLQQDSQWHGVVDGKPRRNIWTHIVGVYVKGGQVKLYINGNLFGQVSVPSSNLFTINNLYTAIGVIDASWNQWQFWDGDIDDIKIYNRAINDKEVFALYKEEINPIMYTTNILISGAGGKSTIETEAGTLQMNASIYPENATSQKVKWSVVNGTGKAEITEDGLLKAIVNGDVTVIASAMDGTGIKDSIVITITGQEHSVYDLSIIRNGNFNLVESNGVPTYWGGWIDAGYGDIQKVVDGVAVLNNTKTHPSEVWHYQFKQSDLDALPNVPYVISFVAWADNDRTIRFDFEDIAENNYNRYGSSSDPEAINGRSEWSFVITTEPKRYTFNVTFDQIKTNTNQGIIFMLTQALGTVYLDDIWLVSEADLIEVTKSFPMISTLEVNSITSTSAVVRGKVIIDGGTAITERGVCWSTTENPTVADSKTSDGTGTGAFTSNITGLTASTTYHVRAFATNSEGTGYGEDLTLTTSTDNPDILAQDDYVLNNIMSGLKIVERIKSGTMNLVIDQNKMLSDNYNSCVKIGDYIVYTKTAQSLDPVDWACQSGTCFTGDRLSPNLHIKFAWKADGTVYMGAIGTDDEILAVIADGTHWTIGGFEGKRTLFEGFALQTELQNLQNASLVAGLTSINDVNTSNFYDSMISKIFNRFSKPIYRVFSSVVLIGPGFVIDDNYKIWCPFSGTSNGTGNRSFNLTYSNYTNSYVSAIAMNDNSNSSYVKIDGSIVAQKINYAHNYYRRGGIYPSSVEIGSTISWSSAMPQYSMAVVCDNITATDLSQTPSGGFSNNHAPLIIPIPVYTVTPVNPSPFIVFHSNQTGNSEIYRCNPDGSNRQKLTSNSAEDYNPKISPDGSKIAFTSNQSGQFEVYIMNNDGSNIQQVTTNGTHGGHNGAGYVRWLNNDYLLYTLNSTIQKIKTDGSENAAIITSANGEGIHNFDYCAATGKIVYQAQGGWGYWNNFYLVNLDGSQSELIVANRQGLEHYPVFNADGTKIVYLFDISGHEESSGRSLNDHLFLRDIGGQNEIDLSSEKPDGMNDLESVLNSNGTKIIFSSQVNDGSQPASLYTVNTTGIGRTLLISDAGSPDFWPRSGDIMPVVPLVSTASVTDITTTTAMSGGNVTSNGGASITERGVCWSTTENPTIADSKTSDGAGAGSFTSNISGLTASTTYHVRAYATNSVGTGYGEELTFKTADVNTKIIAQWTFNEQIGTILNDNSGNLNNGQIIGATWQQDVVKKCLSFNGSNNYITVPHQSILNFGANDFTIEVDFKTSVIPGGSWSSIFSKHNTATNHDKDIEIYIEGGTGKPVFRLSAGTGYFETAKGTFSVCDGTYHTLRCVRKENQLYLYVDGALEANVSASINPNNNNPINIGRSSYNNGYGYFNGLINDITIWNEGLLLNKPIAYAGPNQTVNEGDLVTLDGSDSTEPDGKPLTYHWTAPEGLILSSSTSVNPTFTAPIVDENTHLTFSLVVNNGLVNSTEDEVLITVLNTSICAQYFHPVWEGTLGQDHMNINILEAKYDGLDLEPGDEIGIFDGNLCVGYGKVSKTIDQQNILTIRVSRSDGSGNGYTIGHNVSYVIWDCSASMEYAVTDVQCFDNQSSQLGCLPFGTGATAYVKLSVVSDICQTLEFKTGWNIFSVPNSPNPAGIETVFQLMMENNSLVKMQDEEGNSVENWGIFGGWKNGIGEITPTEGYKIKVSTNCTHEVCGKPVNYPHPIPLQRGWNIMGYPQTGTYNGIAVLQQLIDRGKLVKVQDEAGNSIEDWGIFGGWKNSIGDFVPGKGYKIKVNANDELLIYSSYPKSSAILPELVATIHFHPEFEGNGIDHMNINLVGLPVNVLHAGDELAIFDGVTCVGAITILPHHLQSQTASISVSARDNQGMPGFGEGNPITLKLWNSKQNREFILEPEIVKGTSTFAKHETTIASLEKYTATGLEGLPGYGNTEINFYPNPFSDKVTIEIKLLKDSEVQVEVLNQLGQRVKTITTKQLLPGGLYKLEWDGRNTGGQSVSPGVYHLKVKIDGTSIHKKIVYSK
jgi:flagellar hook assembly protein FlgD